MRQERRGGVFAKIDFEVTLGMFAEVTSNTLFYKNNLYYKNSQPQIIYFEIGILKNIHARCKLIRKTKRGDHKKHFKHTIQGGQG